MQLSTSASHGSTCLAVRLTDVCVPVTADRLYYGVGALYTPCTSGLNFLLPVLV